MNRINLILFVLLLPMFLYGQPAQDWHISNDANLPNIGASDLYKVLASKPSTEVIVAVIDSGVDSDHEDLEGNMWVNNKEIPNNNIDDDKNGYVDDIHGWNFIGNKDGRNVHQDTYEETRKYSQLKNKFENYKGDKTSNDYLQYQKLKEKIDRKRKGAKESLKNIDQSSALIKMILPEAKNLIPDSVEVNLENLALIEAKTNREAGIIGFLSNILQSTGRSFKSIDALTKMIDQQIDEEKEYYYNRYHYGYNPDFNPRTIVGDNPQNLNEKHYGNNDVEGPDARHGTHVAGIIGAVRNNDIGIDGVANNVKIMAIRAVPDGDERDKDIANAIRYAVDNGAKVINMSFGKGGSPNKKLVDKAVRYAAKKDVLLVHAAGNDGHDSDKNISYPHPKYDRKPCWFRKKQADNWITVGALSPSLDPDKMIATFSNYGGSTVDIFAPGDQIYSSVPGSKYEYLSGTSMASPVVAGAAALLRSYFPKLSAKEIKKVILESGSEIQGEIMIGEKPRKKSTLNRISTSGKILNVEKAFLLAQKIAKKQIVQLPMKS